MRAKITRGHERKPIAVALDDADRDRNPAREVPCMDCGEPVGITAEVLDGMREFNRELTRRGEAPLTTSDVARCPACGAAFRKAAGDKANEISARLSAAMSALRNGCDPGSARNHRAYIERFHPKPVEVLRAIERNRKPPEDV